VGKYEWSEVIIRINDRGELHLFVENIKYYKIDYIHKEKSLLKCGCISIKFLFIDNKFNARNKLKILYKGDWK